VADFPGLSEMIIVQLDPSLCAFPRPSGQSPDLLLESPDRPGRYAPLRFTMQRKTESQKLPLPGLATAFFAWFTENILHEQPQNLLPLAYGRKRPVTSLPLPSCIGRVHQEEQLSFRTVQESHCTT
jgi:hypothetical protein